LSASDEGTSVPHDQEWHAPYNPWLIAGVATLTTFMEILDTTIVVVAMPHIAGNLGVSQDAATWIVTSYLLSNAVVIPLTPWLSSLFGRRNLYLVCGVLFTVSSFFCGIAPSFGMLVVFRLIQGLAGGGLVPSTQAILVDTFPARQRAMAMAMFTLVAVTAPAIGPTLGGWITDQFNWRWIFFINVPVGIVSLYLASKYITDPPYLPRRRGPDRFKVDYVGCILIVAGLGGMQLTLSIAERQGWFESSTVVMLTLGSAIAIVAAIFWELHHDDPLIDLRLLKERNLGAAFVLLTLFGLPFYGAMILYPFFLQNLLGYTATWSGLAVSPGGFVLVIMMPFVGWAMMRLDARKMATVGLLILIVALYQMSHFTLETDIRAVVIARMLQCLGISLVFLPVNTMAYTHITREARNSASSLMQLGRNAGASIGIAFVANTLDSQSQVKQSQLVEHLTPYDPAYTDLLNKLEGQFLQASGDPVHAAAQAQGVVYKVLQQQSDVLAFSHVCHLLIGSVILLIPFLFIIRKPKHLEETEPTLSS
jgi:DHA2 family multidrug resistance protein